MAIRAKKVDSSEATGAAEPATMPRATIAADRDRVRRAGFCLFEASLTKPVEDVLDRSRVRVEPTKVALDKGALDKGKTRIQKLQLGEGQLASSILPSCARPATT